MSKELDTYGNTPTTKIPEIIGSYNNLKAGDLSQNLTPGCRSLEGYPGKPGLNFQAVEFPKLASSGEVSMLGNNQAFFFVGKNKETGAPELNTTKLKELLQNIKDNGTHFTLMIDNDVLENPTRFVDKYWPLRPKTEPTEAEKRDFLGKEVKVISDFLSGASLYYLVKDMFMQGKAPSILTEIIANGDVAAFLKDNFKIEGVITEKPLTHGIWKITAPAKEGIDAKTLLATQLYSDSTQNIARPWNLGTEPELGALKSQGNKDAENILENVAKMEALQKKNIIEKTTEKTQSLPANFS